MLLVVHSAQMQDEFLCLGILGTMESAEVSSIVCSYHNITAPRSHLPDLHCRGGSGGEWRGTWSAAAASQATYHRSRERGAR